MIVESMSYEEICREYNRIHDIYYTRLQSKLSPDGKDVHKIRRFMLKHKDSTDVLFKPIKFTVDTNTNFYAIPKIPDYKFLMKKGPTAMTFLTYMCSYGLMALMRVGYNDNEYLFATSHFFDRFAERFLKKDVSKTESICQFFANNTNFIMTSFPTKDNPNNLIGVTDEVIIFGERIASNITFAKTCITRDMLFSSQIGATDMLDENIKFMIEDRERLRQYVLENKSGKLNHISFF